MPDPFSVQRRHFLRELSGLGLGSIALNALTNPEVFAETQPSPKAKRVIYMCQSGAPSQIDLFDYKPELAKRFNQELPESIRKGQRLTTMTSGQERFPIAPSIFDFQTHEQSGATVSSLLPHIASISDEVCYIKSMHTDAINHDPAITFLQTGSEQAGRPSIGAWLSYGLGSENDELPGFVVLLSRGSGRPNCQPLYDRLWGSGFLPSQHQGVKFMSSGDPVLFLNNPAGVDRDGRRENRDAIARLNELAFEEHHDVEARTRIAACEMAFRMQMSVPEVVDISGEPQATLLRYGPNVTKRGSYAYNCLLARRLIERDVRFVQLFHMSWDQHNALPKQIHGQCADTDQPSAALVRDLKERGLLDETLVVWGGEFGRTVYSQGTLKPDNYGRDHHPRCFTMWLAGGGIKPGHTHGETDDFSYNIVDKPVHIHDLNATLLHQLGIDHKQLTYRHQGRDFRLTDVHGTVVADILS
jgi:hypothetical protein